MNTNAMYAVLGIAAIAVGGMIAMKYLDKCDGGLVRYQALGADICVEPSESALLHCLETKVSKYDAKLVRKASGGFDLQVGEAGLDGKFGEGTTQGGTLEIATEHLAQAIDSCKQLGKKDGIDVSVTGSSDTAISIEVN